MLTLYPVVITGPTEGGLGAQTAISLAAGKPAALLLLGRTEAKSAKVIEEIKSISPSTKVQFVQVDLQRFESIRNAATEINKSVEKIDVLINNAGIMAVKEFTLTPEGIEAQFGSNHIGHFLLTNLLLPKLKEGSRIVNLTSHGHRYSHVQLDDYNFQDGKTYDEWKAYGQSKSANILFTVQLAIKLRAAGITSYAVHPGVIQTNLGTHIDPSAWPALIEKFASLGMINLSPFERKYAC